VTEKPLEQRGSSVALLLSTSSSHLPEMSTTFFDTAKGNFRDIPLNDGKVPTTEFLLASESVVQLFDVLGSKAFIPVQKDITGNIKKIRDRQLSQPGQSSTLQDLVTNELAEKKKVASEGLLWLVRGLDFTAQALRKNIDKGDEELATSFTSAYEGTLKAHHGMIVRGIFGVAMKACPYRADFYKKMGEDQDRVQTELHAWLTSLEKIIATLKQFLATTNLK